MQKQDDEKSDGGPGGFTSGVGRVVRNNKKSTVTVIIVIFLALLVYLATQQ